MSVSGFAKVKKHTDTLKGTERTSYHHRCFVVPRDPFSYRGHHQVIYLWDTHISYYWSSFVFVSARHPTEGCWSCSGQAETDPDFILHPRPSAMLLFKHRLNCLFAFSLTNGKLWIFPCYLSRNLLHDPCSSVKPCTFIFRDKISILKCILCVLTLIIRPTITKMLYF